MIGLSLRYNGAIYQDHRYTGGLWMTAHWQLIGFYSPPRTAVCPDQQHQRRLQHRWIVDYGPLVQLIGFYSLSRTTTWLSTIYNTSSLATLGNFRWVGFLNKIWRNHVGTSAPQVNLEAKLGRSSADLRRDDSQRLSGQRWAWRSYPAAAWCSLFYVI